MVLFQFFELTFFLVSLWVQFFSTLQSRSGLESRELNLCIFVSNETKGQGLGNKQPHFGRSKRSRSLGEGQLVDSSSDGMK